MVEYPQRSVFFVIGLDDEVEYEVTSYRPSLKHARNTDTDTDTDSYNKES
jgi:hypothetical protein